MKFKTIIATVLIISSQWAIADQGAALRSGCLGCHQLAVKTVGPAIQDIAKKFSPADIDQLVQTVKNGKDGDQLSWGSTPMPANAAPEADIRAALTWMLSQ